MHYGVDFFFRGHLRSQRRIALLTVALHLVVLASALVLQIPAVRLWLRPITRPIVRFGYEGPEHFVERIQLMTNPVTQLPMVDVGNVKAVPSRRGGGGLEPSSRALAEEVRRVSMLSGPGDDELTRLAEARASQRSVPLVQSSELVIESMDYPRYPEQLHQQGIEGRVALMALIDTTGNVADISVVLASGHDEFETSAIEAVRRAKFRPYRTEGTAQEVYALIRYRFRIY